MGYLFVLIVGFLYCHNSYNNCALTNLRTVNFFKLIFHNILQIYEKFKYICFILLKKSKHKSFPTKTKETHLKELGL